MPRISTEKLSLLLIGSAIAGAALSGCSSFSTPSATTRTFTSPSRSVSHLELIANNPNVYELRLPDSTTRCSPIYATTLEQCRAVNPKGPSPRSVAKLGLTRQLLIGFQQVSIKDHGTLEVAAGALATISGQASLDGNPVLLTGATLATATCTRDYVFWARRTPDCDAGWASLQPEIANFVVHEEQAP